MTATLDGTTGPHRPEPIRLTQDQRELIGALAAGSTLRPAGEHWTVEGAGRRWGDRSVWPLIYAGVITAEPSADPLSPGTAYHLSEVWRVLKYADLGLLCLACWGAPRGDPRSRRLVELGLAVEVAGGGQLALWQPTATGRQAVAGALAVAPAPGEASEGTPAPAVRTP